MSWEDISLSLYDAASRLYDEGKYSASLLVSYLAIKGFLEKASKSYLEEALKEIGGLEALKKIEEARHHVLSGLREASDQEALLALRALRLLAGVEESVVSISLIKPLVFLALALLIISFFLEGRIPITLPIWIDAVRIPAIAVSAIVLFDEKLRTLIEHLLERGSSQPSPQEE